MVSETTEKFGEVMAQLTTNLVGLTCNMWVDMEGTEAKAGETKMETIARIKKEGFLKRNEHIAKVVKEEIHDTEINKELYLELAKLTRENSGFKLPKEGIDKAVEGMVISNTLLSIAQRELFGEIDYYLAHKEATERVEKSQDRELPDVIVEIAEKAIEEGYGKKLLLPPYTGKREIAEKVLELGMDDKEMTDYVSFIYSLMIRLENKWALEEAVMTNIVINPGKMIKSLANPKAFHDAELEDMYYMTSLQVMQMVSHCYATGEKPGKELLFELVEREM